MAYSPLEQGRLPQEGALAAVAARHDVTPEQVALAWSIREPGVCAIVKAGREQHLRDNRAAVDLELNATDLAELDRAFPQPSPGAPLEWL